MRKVLLIMFFAFFLSSFVYSQSKILKGRLLGIDPDGKVKYVQGNGKDHVLRFDYENIEIVEKKGDKYRKSDVFDLTIGDVVKIFVEKKKVTRLVYEEAKESLRDFLFKNQKVKMMKGQFKQLDTNNMKLYLYNEPEFFITAYTKYIPHYGQFVSKDTVIVGYIDGLEEGTRIAKWVRLKKRK